MKSYQIDKGSFLDQLTNQAHMCLEYDRFSLAEHQSIAGVEGGPQGFCDSGLQNGTFISPVIYCPCGAKG